MSVTELACFRVSVPIEAVRLPTMSGDRRYEALESTIVRVTADDGTVGFGEASALGGAYLDGFLGSTEATVRELAPLVLSCDPLQAIPLVHEMDRAVLGHHPGKAAIDIAMWDLRARLLDVPVGVLLGGIQQTSLGAFAAVNLGSTDAMTQDARTLSDLGYGRLQVKVGDDPSEDAERLSAVLEAVGQDLRYLSCDANRGWTAAEALRFARAIADVDAYLEQPCPSIAELVQLRSRCRHPIIIDEAAKQPRDLLDALALGCIDGINLKPVRVGGLTKAVWMRDVAQSARLMIVVDEPMGGRVATAGIAQLGATVDPELLLGVSFLSDHGEPSARTDTPDQHGPRFDAGHVSVPLDPGLGVRVGEEMLGEPVFVVRKR